MHTMRWFRLFTAALALSGVGGLHSAAHALEGDHSHAHDGDAPHSHGHDADHHGHDLQAEDGAQARLLPTRAALPPRGESSWAFEPAKGHFNPCFAGFAVAPTCGGAPPGRKVPTPPARAPPA